MKIRQMVKNNYRMNKSSSMKAPQPAEAGGSPRSVPHPERMQRAPLFFYFNQNWNVDNF
jgi:hypothetical protein